MDAIRSRVKRPYMVVAAAVVVALGLGLLIGLLNAHRGGEQAGGEASVNVTSNGTSNGMAGKAENAQTRIIGGRPAVEGEAPQYLGSFGTGTKHVCNALLVLPRFVWTTADCMMSVIKYGLKFTINRLSLDDVSQGERRGVVDHRIHPKWNPINPIIRERWAYNEAVGELDGDIENVTFPCLAANGSFFPTGIRGAIFGYGRTGTSEDLAPPRTLQVANVTVYDLEDCKKIYRRRVKNNMICIGNDAGGQNICQGDDGAPLLVNGVVGGMATRGPRNCEVKNSPGVLQMPGDPFMEDAINQMRDEGPQCGIRNQEIPDLKVENGQVVEPHSWPFVVWIEWEDGHFYGGGVLTDELHVLTKYGRPGDYVVAGGHNRSSTTESRQRIKIEKVTRNRNHTSYPYGPWLLKLSQPVKLTPHIRPICVPDPDFSLPAGTKCVLVGWGDLWAPGYPRVTDLPRQGVFTTITTEECRDAWAWASFHNYITDHNVVCTAAAETYPWNDEGGALMCEKDDIWYPYGVMFFHTDDTLPALFFKIPSHAQWINKESSLYRPTPGQVCYKKFEG